MERKCLLKRSLMVLKQMGKLRLFSIEQCEKCDFPDINCFSANLVKGEYQLCSHAKLREHFEDWECDICGERLGLKDLRHRVPVEPSKEIEKLTKEIEKLTKEIEKLKKGEMYVGDIQTYCDLITVCDKCFNEHPRYELFCF